MKLTASIDNGAYTRLFGFRHYGTDMISNLGNTKIYASGDGIVLHCGWDNACGNIVAVRYDNVFNHKKNIVENIVLRYFHLSQILIKKAQIVNKDTVIGNYGMTGNFGGTGMHLHLEADLDVKYSLYTPSVSKSNFLRGTRQGAYFYDSDKNTVRNVMDFLHCKDSSPDNQSLISSNSKYVDEKDFSVKYY